MDFALSDEQTMMLDTVRRFVRKELDPLLPEVQRAEIRGQRFPDRGTVTSLQEKAKTAGIWGLLTPAEYGGADVGLLMASLITMETACSLVSFEYGGNADNILYSGTEEQKREYLEPTIRGERRSCFALSEPDTGSDATNLKTRAVRDGEDWVIDGQKTWISGAHEADYAIVYALTDPEKRGQGGITAFLVDRDMGWTERPIPLMSAWEASDVFFDGARVPARNVLGEVGEGFGLAMQWIGHGRVMIPSRAVGQAQALLQMALDYSRQRIAFGYPIADNQAIQWMLADSVIEIEQVKWTTLYAAWRADQGLDARHQASIAKVSGANMVWRVADRVLQIHGGVGYSRELPVERILREVRVYRIFEGTDEIQKRSIARNLLRDHVRVGDWD
jgi:acyl-CoA dehydrogenase